MIRLPVSAVDVVLRLPDGADEIAFCEGDPEPLAAAARLLGRVATRQDGGAADWSLLPVTDFEILLLHLRHLLLGPAIASHVACPACGERVEVSFQVPDYIAAIRPVVPPGVATGPDEGWLALDGIAFRLPVMADLAAARRAPDPEAALRARCTARGAASKAIRRIERALARLAPPVTGPVGGACPDCGAMLLALFDVASFVVAELRRLAAALYAEIHLLAATYHWAEPAILALPATRRRRYAELVRDEPRHAGAGA